MLRIVRCGLATFRPTEHRSNQHRQAADMLRILLSPFLIYRSFFFPFFVLSLVVAPVWLVARFYQLRSRTHPVSLRREAVLLLLVVYLAGVASATLAPNHGSRARA